MFKRLLAILTLLAAGASALPATTWYVATTGSDSGNGGPASPWQTIGKAANAAVAGDTVNIAAGTYNGSVTFNTPGNSNSPVTFIGPGVVIAGNLTIAANYVTVNGVTDSPPAAGGFNAITVAGLYDILTNCTVANYGATAADQATAIGITGSYDIIAGCVIENLNDIDAFHLWGHNNLIEGCVVTNVNQVNYNLNHTDFLQTWGANVCYSNTILNCLCVNSTCQSGNTEIDASATSGAGGMHDLYFINCVWANVENPFYCGVPRTFFYNCVFYKTAQNVSSGDQPIVFYGITNYSSVGSAVVNCVFLECGSDPSNAQLGGIGNDGFDLATISIENNYFAGSGYAAKNGAYIGTNAVNGGSPKFTDESAFNFQPNAGGTLIGAGLNLTPLATTDRNGNPRPETGPWDIGAYVFGTVTNQSFPTLTVSAIANNAIDVDPIAPGLQVYEGTVVSYSASAFETSTNAVSWQWTYAVDGGSPVVYQTGTNAVTGVQFDYGAGTGGNTYVWKLSATDGKASASSSFTTGVEVPPVAATNLSFEATQGTITYPLTVTGTYVSQPVQTVISNAGEATFNFTITNAGNYLVQALVNAPNPGPNSFYVSLDTQPVDPTTCWDIPNTTNFQQRIVGWRGNGTVACDQYVPKVFTLSAGAHQIIFAGRDPNTELESFNLLPMPPTPQNLRVLPTVSGNSPSFNAGP